MLRETDTADSGHPARRTSGQARYAQAMNEFHPARSSSTWSPPLAAATLGLGLSVPGNHAVLWGCALMLFLAVVAAVHHAETVAARLGEPLGTLVLALAVTVIEVSLILSVSLSGGASAATLARDTIYSTVMIICAGVVGLCLLVGGWTHREQKFNMEGSNGAAAALLALSVLVLVLPNYTATTRGPMYSEGQLIFVAVVSLALWAFWVFVQTVRHREYFMALEPPADPHVQVPMPSLTRAWWSLALLLVALVSVVGLAKVLSPPVEAALAAAHAPKAMVGVIIALVVLLPEAWAALRAAQANRLQSSFNLAFGSALASIGLTIPVVAGVSVWRGVPLTLGLEAKETVLLALTFMVSMFTLSSGRTYVLPGAIHLVIFAVFLFLSWVP